MERFTFGSGPYVAGLASISYVGKIAHLRDYAQSVIFSQGGIGEGLDGDEGHKGQFHVAIFQSPTHYVTILSYNLGLTKVYVPGEATEHRGYLVLDYSFCEGLEEALRVATAFVKGVKEGTGLYLALITKEQETLLATGKAYWEAERAAHR